MELLNVLRRGMSAIDLRVRALANRAAISAVDDGAGVQTLQVTVLAGERLNQVLRLQPFGFTGNPPPGTTGLLICMGGSRTHAVFLEGDHGTRKKNLESGESAQYNEWGDFLYLKEDGTAHLKAREKAFVEAPEAEFTGNVKISGTLIVDGAAWLKDDLLLNGDAQLDGNAHVDGALSSDTSVADPNGTMQEMRGVYNVHAHTPAVDPQMT